MATFQYTARDTKGALINGIIAAPNASDAGRLLRAEGKYVVKLNETRNGAVAGEPILTLEQAARRVRRDDVIYFTHQMSIMVQTGVPISEALDSVCQQTTNEHFRRVLEDVANTVNSGSCLSAALSKHMSVFPQLMISLLEASEASGTMGSMFERISLYLGKERATVKKVRGAMMYPAFMATMAIGVTIFLLTFVLPRFANIYAGRGATLPAPTRILMATSGVLIQYWYLFLGGFIGAIVGFLYIRTTDWGRSAIDQLKLSTPVLGTMFSQLYITRAMQTMGTMIAAGVPVLDMIAITKRVTNNVHFKKLWDSVDARLQQGSQLSDALHESPLIPKSISRMISSGERAGRLGQVMEKIAEFTENDFDESVRRVTQFIEPLMISVMGTIIGGVAISLLLPIFSISKVMTGH
ncbi:MAG: type II secretion system F family protein [Planctomycetes bacterium]|nr:type II secretion system F family protein [Planctomycetota bacterium]